MKEQILSYEITLPQRIYPYLDGFFSVFKSQVNFYIPKLWNEKDFKLLSQKGSAVRILKKEFSIPEGLPSRVFRNVLELTGQIIRSQIERREVFEKLLRGVERVLALDLSPSEKRLSAMVLVEGEKVSKPLFFKTQMLRKIERLHFEVSALERKIDNIHSSIEKTACKREKERLWERLRHLFAEQKRKQRKIKQIRKQILETFTNFVVAHAKVYDCQAIVIEDLSFKEVPDWKDKRALRRFSQWFYSRFASRLEEKARLYNLNVIKVNPSHTSRVCHKCSKEGKVEGLVFKCFCGTYDRDYNGSVNIAFRLIKPKAQGAEGIPGSIPSRLVQV